MISFPLKIVILSVLILVSAVSGAWLLGDRHWTAPQPQPPDQSVLQRESGLVAAPPAAYAEQAARPLFITARRPSAPAQDTQSARSGELGDSVLVGLFAAPDGVAGAILRSKSGKVQRLVVGQTFAGWRLQAVVGKTAHFSGPEGARALELIHLPQDAAAVSAKLPTTSDEQPTAQLVRERRQGIQPIPRQAEPPLNARQ